MGELPRPADVVEIQDPAPSGGIEPVTWGTSYIVMLRKGVVGHTNRKAKSINRTSRSWDIPPTIYESSPRHDSERRGYSVSAARNHPQ